MSHLGKYPILKHIPSRPDPKEYTAWIKNSRICQNETQGSFKKGNDCLDWKRLKTDPYFFELIDLAKKTYPHGPLFPFSNRRISARKVGPKRKNQNNPARLIPYITSSKETLGYDSMGALFQKTFIYCLNIPRKVARVRRARSCGERQICSPRRPALTKICSRSTADASMMVGNCFFCPRGLIPPVM